MPGDVTLWPGITGGEAIDLLGRLRGGLDPARRAELLERFDLDPRKKARSYSKGNRQKVALVAALASDAELLILDEPTSGLDPLMEAVFQECIREVRAEGRTVLLSSHILAEVEALCDRVSIIRHGRTVQSGTLTELRHLTRTSIVAETDAPGRRPRRRCPACTTSRSRTATCGSTSTPTTSDDVLRHLTDVRRPVAAQRPADAGGAVPAPLRRRTGRGRRRPLGRRRAGRERSRARRLAGTGPLVRFALRRDRLRLPLWVAAGAGLVASQSLGSQTLYDTPEALAGYRASVGSNAATIALSGPPVGLDTVGGAVAFEISASA